MRRARIVIAAALALVAVVTGVLLVSVQYGLVVEYGSGGNALITALAVIPIGAALLSATAAGSWGRTTRVTLLVFTIVLVIGLLGAPPVGHYERDRRAAENDRTFSCNGPNAEVEVDERVDAAFHEFPHPALLYGPIEGSPYGCTAGIDGHADDTFASWRDVLVSSDWSVADDTGRVRLTHGDLVAVLYRDGDTALLRVTANEPTECDQTSSDADGGEVVAC